MEQEKKLVELRKVPNTTHLFAKALLSLSSGQHTAPVLPDPQLCLPSACISQAFAEQYHTLVHWQQDSLHTCLPHMLVFPLQLQLMLQKRFPFPVIGLVHIANQIKQHGPLLVDKSLSLKCYADGLEKHTKGWQFSIVCEVFQQQTLVWQSVSKYLRLTAALQSSGDNKVELSHCDLVDSWSLSEDVGRQYAAVSKDYNPIHLYAWSAKLFGLKRHILHGMYAKARCLSALMKPDNIEVDVNFKKPIFLPSTVNLQKQASAGERDFQLIGEQGQLHLTGTINQ